MSIRRRFIHGNEDLTFIFREKLHGFKITVIDNSNEIEIKLDDISPSAEAYYIAQLIDITKQKLNQKHSA